MEGGKKTQLIFPINFVFVPEFYQMNRLQWDGVPAVPNPSQRFVVLVRLPPVDRLQVLRLQRDPIAGRDPGRGSGTRVVVCPVI